MPSFLRSLVASCDNWNFNTSNPVIYVGGNYNQNGNHGLFYVNYTNATNANGNLGSRFLFCVANNHPPHTAQVVAHPSVKISYKGAGKYTPACMVKRPEWPGRWNVRLVKRRKYPYAKTNRAGQRALGLYAV